MLLSSSFLFLVTHTQQSFIHSSIQFLNFQSFLLSQKDPKQPHTIFSKNTQCPLPTYSRSIQILINSLNLFKIFTKLCCASATIDYTLFFYFVLVTYIICHTMFKPTILILYKSMNNTALFFFSLYPLQKRMNFFFKRAFILLFICIKNVFNNLIQ